MSVQTHDSWNTIVFLSLYFFCPYTNYIFLQSCQFNLSRKLGYCIKHLRIKHHFHSISVFPMRGSDSLWSLKILGCPSKKSRGVTPASWPNSPIDLWPSWPPNHPHTLIGFITRLFSTNKLVCGGRSGAIWLPSHHHPGGCCTLVVDEEIPPFYVKRFEYPEKHYINVRNYYLLIIMSSREQNSHFMVNFCKILIIKMKVAATWEAVALFPIQ